MNLDFCEAHPNKLCLLENAYIFRLSELSLKMRVIHVFKHVDSK